LLPTTAFGRPRFNAPAFAAIWPGGNRNLGSAFRSPASAGPFPVSPRRGQRSRPFLRFLAPPSPDPFGPGLLSSCGWPASGRISDLNPLPGSGCAIQNLPQATAPRRGVTPSGS
jgi:hypothetical protein